MTMDISFERIVNELSPYFRDFESRYLNDFPEVERREVEDLIRLLNAEESPITLEAILCKDDFVGFISYWHLPQFIYLEHFAIDPNKRSNGIGRQVIGQIQKRFSGARFVLEAEPPTDHITTRRIKFYERLGFTLSDIPYIQPSYRADGESIPLRIMTLRFSQPIDEGELDDLRRYVYDIKL